jgi:hypothetical protein
LSHPHHPVLWVTASILHSYLPRAKAFRFCQQKSHFCFAW